jgi:hypothetical protein
LHPDSPSKQKEILAMKTTLTMFVLSLTLGLASTLAQAEDTVSSVNIKSAKNCVDETGVTFKRGDKGFSSCLDKMKKSHSDQMGGTMPSDTSPTSPSTQNTSTPDTTLPAGSNPSSAGGSNPGSAGGNNSGSSTSSGNY